MQSKIIKIVERMAFIRLQADVKRFISILCWCISELLHRKGMSRFHILQIFFIIFSNYFMYLCNIHLEICNIQKTTNNIVV